MIWRPILAQVTTLHEMQSHWTLTELYDCHEALDIKTEADQYYLEQNKPKKGKK